MSPEDKRNIEGIALVDQMWMSAEAILPELEALSASEKLTKPIGRFWDCLRFTVSLAIMEVSARIVHRTESETNEQSSS